MLSKWVYNFCIGADQQSVHIFKLTLAKDSISMSGCQSSETPGPNFFKLYVEPSVKGGYTNGHDSSTKMAAKPMYGKNTKKSSSPNQESFEAESWIQHWYIHV